MLVLNSQHKFTYKISYNYNVLNQLSAENKQRLGIKLMTEEKSV